MTTKLTIELWDEVTEAQSENLNGGSGFSNITMDIAGGVGGVQINGSDGAQINLRPQGKGSRFRVGYYGGYYRRHCH
jgi:hypothetical protein